MKSYKPKEIEPKWQKAWAESKIYRADLKSDKPKYIAMSMFNYPSGAGIHIGHAMNYTISDVKARFKRQSGYESYHPVGWDAFGLPAENYAIKAGISPQESMAKIIPGYHKQYKAMGWSNDWDKEIATHEPEYYKWTQWIFSQLYKHGLAYQDSRLQWWCEIDNTVLANEQVIDGKCWRHDGPDDPYVKQKEVKQWFFKITEYADELLDAIDDLEWTESVKIAQKNWIGRSQGAEVDFGLDFGDAEINARTGPDGKKAHLTVFTTRPDTLFGATFLVLAPEHPWVSLALEHQTVIKNQDEVQEYVQAAKLKSELDRQADKSKTGVKIEGVQAVNPVNGENIPIYVADYVLPGYGTGAIMGVPAHDKRDFEFAQRFGLPVVRVIKNSAPDDECTTDEGVLINSGKYDGMDSAEAREKITADLVAQGLAAEKINYKMRDWSVSRQRYWGAPIPIIHCEKCGPQLVEDDKLPVELPLLDDFAPTGDGRSALARATDWLKTDCPKCGGPAERETDTLDTYICSSWYMLRYLDPHNADKIFDSDIVNKWLPIDFYNGADHATAHLLYARFITRFFTKIGLVDNPEPFKRMLFNGKVTNSDGTPFSKSKGNVVDPLEIIESGYGADALRTYLMFTAPLELGARWDPQGVPGTYRFISRAWSLVQEYVAAPPDGSLSPDAEKQIRRVTHQMISKVSEDIENNRYNTAIAAAMSAVNDLFKLKVDNLTKHPAWQEALDALVACIAPFAPHAAEELWHDLSHEDSVHVDHWPVHEEKYLTAEEIIIVVQVNGKVRANVSVKADADEAAIIAAAEADENVRTYLQGGVKKKIYVPKKLVNFVV